MENLEIVCDSSLRTMPESKRVFTCSGALCINTGEEDYMITPDSTNNRGELLAVYLACKMALRVRSRNPNIYSKISIYSDSQFAIFGLKKWMSTWLTTRDEHGTLYNSTNEPVKNQELFKMIITYCVINKLVIHFYNHKGHIKSSSANALALSNQHFFTANGFFLRPEDIYKISFYNNLIDNNTREKLETVNELNYPQLVRNPNSKDVLPYIIPENYTKYIR